MTQVTDFGVTFLDSITDRILFTQIEAQEAIDTELTSQTALLTTISGFDNSVILSNIDTELESQTTLMTAGNASLATIAAAPPIDQTTALADVNSELDAQTVLITAGNASLATIAAAPPVDQTTALADINSELDAQTVLITAGNASLATIAAAPPIDQTAALAAVNSELDAQTVLITAGNASLATIAAAPPIDQTAALAAVNSELDAQTTLLTSIDNNTPRDFRYEVALGRITGSKTWSKFGNNVDVDTGSGETLANWGGLFTPLMTASTLTISSDSTDDDVGGTGALQIKVTGVDANHDLQEETFVLTGTTNVVSTSTWLGVNQAQIVLSGSGLTNAGTIDVIASSDSSIQMRIDPEEGVGQQIIFFTQAGHTTVSDWLLLNADKITGNGEPRVNFKLFVFSYVTNTTYKIGEFLLDTSAEVTIELNSGQPFVVEEKSVIWINVTTDKNQTQVNGRLSLMEILD
jgi:hypothetical protein